MYMLVLVMYLNFCTDVLLMAPGAIGLIFLISKLWDAVSDPLVGYWSDRSQATCGRRRLWMIASCIPLGAFNIMLWWVPSTLNGGSLALWTAVGLLGFYTAFTGFAVPHMALGAELSDDPRQRNRVFGTRQLCNSLGMLLAFIVGLPLLENAARDNHIAGQIAVWAATASCAIMLCCAIALPQERADYRGRGSGQALHAVRDVWVNPHARLLLSVFFIENLGMGAIAVMTPYLMKYVIQIDGVIGPVMLVYVLASVLAIPVWVRLAGSCERHQLWAAAMGISCVGYGLVMFQAEGRVGLMFLTSLLTGIGSACGATLGQALKADVIDVDEHLTGQRKEGTYFAAWNLMAKAAGGLMVAVCGLALQWVGFEPGAEQTAQTQRVILALMGGVPLLAFALALGLLSQFRLTRAEHRRIRQAIEGRYE
jgi:GPH family glycoside/pentoside/hexuronide:cation symporter